MAKPLFFSATFRAVVAYNFFLAPCLAVHDPFVFVDGFFVGGGSMMDGVDLAFYSTVAGIVIVYISNVISNIETR